jgi:hypothetical protein
MLLLGVRLFIAAIFTVLAASFLATTGVLISEYPGDWPALATFYSHLFVFFPTFGIVALVAFYTPACVFLDLYWRHVPYGRIRFIVGFCVVAALSWAAAAEMQRSPERSVWEIAPKALLADAGDPAGCVSKPGAPAGSCSRMPILTAMHNIRDVSQKRIGLADLARNCEPDPLVAPTEEAKEIRRFCFASTPLAAGSTLIGDADCCRAQRALLSAVNGLAAQQQNRSLTGLAHNYLLPFKLFFMLMLLTISIMLAARRQNMEKHYHYFLPGIERGVLIGAAAMIFYPVMSHAFLQSAALLYGQGTDGFGYRTVAPFLSFAFGIWGLLILFFFYRRRDKEVQALARMGGIIGSAIAIVKYDRIIDFCVRIFGSGASLINMVVLVAVALFALVALLYYARQDIGDAAVALTRAHPRRGRAKGDETADEAAT